MESLTCRHSLNRLVGHLRKYTSVRWSDVDLQRKRITTNQASIPNQSIDQLTDTDLTGLGDDMILRYNSNLQVIGNLKAPFDESYLSLTDLPTISQVGNTGEYRPTE